MKINCIAIDDEPPALDKLVQYIQKIPYLVLAGAFENASKGLEMLKQTQVDLMYLDINMPDISGIELIRGLNDPPEIILTTAYQQYALEGFELNVTDYLLKPFSFNRFLKATERAHDQLLLQAKVQPAPDDFMFVKSEHNIIKIAFSDIHYVEGYKDYVKIYLQQERPVLTISSLKSIEDLLPPGRFLRIHKSFIISVDKIVSLRNGKIKIKEKSIPIGDSYRDTFQNMVMKGRLR
jgi:DNA-binding LytR/AlgR family response regulator